MLLFLSILSKIYGYKLKRLSICSVLQLKLTLQQHRVLYSDIFILVLLQWIIVASNVLDLLAKIETLIKPESNI